MTFTAEQKAALSADLDKRNVKQRSQSGRNLSYVEGWMVIAEANRIFGFDGWDRETTELKCVAEKEREIGAGKLPGWSVTYIAKVRVQVGTVVREGCGSGHGIDRDLGQAHESALKEAETDAMKRALMTFGNPFGLALYDKGQTHVSNTQATEQPATRRPAPAVNSEADKAAPLIKALRERKTEEALVAWGSDPRTQAAIGALSEADAARVREDYGRQLKAVRAPELLRAG